MPESKPTQVELFDSRATLTLEVAAGESVAEAAWRALNTRLASGADPELVLLVHECLGAVDAMFHAARQAKGTRPADLSARMAQLAASFPTLEGVPGAMPFDASVLRGQLAEPAHGSGARAAIQFVLHVWNQDNPFDLKAFGAWDRVHRGAFVAWASDPFWG